MLSFEHLSRFLLTLCLGLHALLFWVALCAQFPVRMACVTVATAAAVIFFHPYFLLWRLRHLSPLVFACLHPHVPYCVVCVKYPGMAIYHACKDHGFVLPPGFGEQLPPELHESKLLVKDNTIFAPYEELVEEERDAMEGIIFYGPIRYTHIHHQRNPLYQQPEEQSIPPYRVALIVLRKIYKELFAGGV